MPPAKSSASTKTAAPASPVAATGRDTKQWSPVGTSANDVTVEWHQIAADGPVGEAYREMFGQKEPLPPLARTTLKLRLVNTPGPIANALRRVVLAEMPGYRLTFDDTYDHEVSTDPMMSDVNFVRTRIRNLPIRPQVSDAVLKNVRLALDIANTTEAAIDVYARDLQVTAGQLDAPLVNLHHTIAFVQPGAVVRITDIRLERGLGTDDATFNVAATAMCRPVGVPTWPESATQDKDGEAIALSQYKSPALVSDALEHELVIQFPAHPDDPVATKLVFADACRNLLVRLRQISGAVEAAGAGAATLAGEAAADSGGFLSLDVSEGGRKGVLSAPGETVSVGAMLQWAVFNRDPSVEIAAYTCVPHEKMMKLTVALAKNGANNDVVAIISAAIDDLSMAIEQIAETSQ